MLFLPFLIYAALSGLATISMTANAKQIPRKLQAICMRAYLPDFFF